MPSKARPAKHLLGEPSSGPYTVVSQTTLNSVKLKDSEGQLVDKGADIPLEQILVGPRRGHLQFERSNEGDKSIGQLVAGEAESELPEGVKATGWKPSKRKGWRGLTKGMVVCYRPSDDRELLVAHVHYNDRNAQSVVCHSCRPDWTGTSVVWEKEYRSRSEEGEVSIVTTPTEDPVMINVHYRQLVLMVELYQDGRIVQGYASTLAKGGWRLRLDHADRVNAVSAALVLDEIVRRDHDD